MGRRRWQRISSFLILTLQVGCWHFRVRPASPLHLQEPFNDPRTEVFDAILSEAHQMNLEVKVLEKASGLVRFETVRLSPAQMDRYCRYPLESTGCRQLPTTFSGAADFARAEGSGESGWGVISITVLVTATGADTSVADVRANGEAAITLCNVPGVYTVTSTGVLERELVDGVTERLAASPASG